MAQKQPSFAIVDDDDDEDFDLENDSDEVESPVNKVAPSLSKRSAVTRTQQVSREYESSEEEDDVLEPFKNGGLQVLPDALDLPNAGPSNGRQTVTKIRAPPPQLLHISSDTESDDSELGGKKPKATLPGEYDPKQYENLEVGDDVKELFQYITKYVPQQLGHDYKFKPFIPDFLPAVGDIDAFLKVIPPEVNINGEPHVFDQSELGLVVLDEPAANQSDPAVLHLQLRASTVNVSQSADMVVKKVHNVEKSSKIIEKWIKDISDLHKSKSSPVLKYNNPMPELDDLMEEWPENMENLLKIHGFPSYNLSGALTRYIDIICCLFDIPVYQNRIESLHLLFSLYAAVKTSHLFRPTSKNRNPEADQLVLE